MSGIKAYAERKAAGRPTPKLLKQHYFDGGGFGDIFGGLFGGDGGGDFGGIGGIGSGGDIGGGDSGVPWGEGTGLGGSGGSGGLGGGIGGVGGGSNGSGSNSGIPSWLRGLIKPGMAGGLALLAAYMARPNQNNTQQQMIKSAQDYAKNFVKIPTTSTTITPFPIASYKPGMMPQRRQVSTQLTGYISPGQGYYARGGPIPPSGIAALGAGAPGAFLDGPTPGMDDSVPGQVDGNQPVALSHGEFVIPADVVAHLGDGNSKAGAARLHDMVREIRVKKTGRPSQPGKIKPNRVMP